MKVIYHGHRQVPELEAVGIRRVPHEELLRVADIVSLHRPASAPGDPFELGDAEIALMKTGTLLVNTVHPDLIDPVALKHAIENSQMRAAVDDVGAGAGWRELAAMGPDRFLRIPQMGFMTRDAGLRAGIQAVTAVCDVLDGSHTDFERNPDYEERRLSRSRESRSVDEVGRGVRF